MEQASSWRRNTYIICINNSLQNPHISKSKYLLALHSCSESFGVAVKDIDNPTKTIKSKVFDIGHSLSNKLFSCVETLLPKKSWRQIIRISVAKGPGSFTSTRLTLSMARTISQQIDCSLDAISTFRLMAQRLHNEINQESIYHAFWIKDVLPRRGFIAGKYQLLKIHDKSNFHEFNEVISPQLINNEQNLIPSINAKHNLEKDLISLIEISEFYKNLKVNSDWNKALPIYPTSPLDNKTVPRF